MVSTNQILERLSPEVIERLEPDFRLVTLEVGKVLHSPGEEIRELYFPLTCMISITVTMAEGKTVEAGAVGSREAVGLNAFMGGSETTQTEFIVQLPGDAVMIASAPLKLEFDSNREFRGVMLRCTQALIAQVSQNVGCNRIHTVEQRCNRWLLEVRERVQTDKFGLTQEFISQMLGASRPIVSQTLHDLKEAGVINYSRGHINILDPDALTAKTCECYSVLQAEYKRLLGPSKDRGILRSFMARRAGI
jgi:CRP-like cAMP-binding protein